MGRLERRPQTALCGPLWPVARQSRSTSAAVPPCVHIHESARSTSLEPFTFGALRASHRTCQFSSTKRPHSDVRINAQIGSIAGPHGFVLHEIRPR